MKIAIFDSNNGKFTTDMQAWWENKGHEVQRQGGYNPEIVMWADIVWFDLCDNNLVSATNPDQALKDEWKYSNRIGAWDMHEMDLSNKKVIVRAIDIEVWVGHQNNVKWDVVDDVIFIAPHIQKLFNKSVKDTKFKQHVIPCGVDLNRWTFRPNPPKNNKVGIVAERWVSKGVDYAVQLAIMMPDYEFHWLGRNNDYAWENAYVHDKIEKVCPNLILEEDFVDDLDKWWDDKDFCLSCSKKEAFGYNIAEAMAKGITPVIHTFYGAEDFWPDYLRWDTVEKAADMLKYSLEPQYIQALLVELGYTIPQMMEKFMEVING